MSVYPPIICGLYDEVCDGQNIKANKATEAYWKYKR